VNPEKALDIPWFLKDGRSNVMNSSDLKKTREATD
jgi:hypothetical protein